MSEVEVQQNFLVALYLLDKENPDGHFGHRDIARNAGLEDSVDALISSVIPHLLGRRYIRIIGLGSQLQIAITPFGREAVAKVVLGDQESKESKRV